MLCQFFFNLLYLCPMCCRTAQAPRNSSTGRDCQRLHVAVQLKALEQQWTYCTLPPTFAISQHDTFSCGIIAILVMWYYRMDLQPAGELCSKPKSYGVNLSASYLRVIRTWFKVIFASNGNIWGDRAILTDDSLVQSMCNKTVRLDLGQTPYEDLQRTRNIIPCQRKPRPILPQKCKRLVRSRRQDKDEDEGEVHPRSHKRTRQTQEQDDEDEDDAQVYPARHNTPSVCTLTLYLFVCLTSCKRTWPSQEQDEEDVDDAKVYPTLHITTSVHTLPLYLFVCLTSRMVLGSISREDVWKKQGDFCYETATLRKSAAPEKVRTTPNAIWNPSSS